LLRRDFNPDTEKNRVLESTEVVIRPWKTTQLNEIHEWCALCNINADFITRHYTAPMHMCTGSIWKIKNEEERLIFVLRWA
jgi:hypothetical protein